MKKEEYEAIILHLEKENQDIQKEMMLLQHKKQQLLNKVKIEQEKLRQVDETFRDKKSVYAHQLQHTFNYRIMKQIKQEIQQIDVFIQKERKELEKNKVKKEEVEKIYFKKIKENERLRRRKQEDKLFELRNILSNKEASFEKK